MQLDVSTGWHDRPYNNFRNFCYE